MNVLMILFLLIFFFVLFFLFRPSAVHIDAVSPAPSRSYQESLSRIAALRSQDGSEIADYCHAIVLTHGRKTEHAVVMYHGYTNCPRQYEKLAGMFFERGYNVYVPRIPYHGSRDLLTQETGQLTAEELTHVCQDSLDIAQGLGNRVTVLGLSMGGVMASWSAQFRPDAAAAVIIVPSFAWYFLPGMIRPIIRLSRVFPDMYLWWDPFKREKRKAPYSMYHKFSTRGVGEVFRMGLAVLEKSRRKAPGSRSMIVMTNEMDIAVDERITRDLIARWRRHGAHVEHYIFPRKLKMEHDIIDPLHPYEQTDIVYKKIFEMIERQQDIFARKNL